VHFAKSKNNMQSNTLLKYIASLFMLTIKKLHRLIDGSVHVEVNK